MTQKAFSTLAFALLALVTIVSSQANQKTLPASVIKVLASRKMRHHHFLWHNIRENWNRLSADSQKQITDLGWAPPHPARRYDADNNSIAISDNFSGEDFLYMHRQMIAQVNQILAANNETYGRVTGWKKLPTPHDKDWPVPENYNIPNYTARTAVINKWKTEAFYNETIAPMERNLTDYNQLRNMTLGEYGTRIEVTLHAWYHLRFSSESPYGYRSPIVVGLPDIDKKWDDPRYSWLVDNYASTVHPIFWKIHGWVDDRIEDWRKANGLTSIRWTGTWTGGPMQNVASMWNRKETGSSLRGSAAQASENSESMEMDHEAVMQQVVQIFLKEGKEVSFGDPVVLDLDLKA